MILWLLGVLMEQFMCGKWKQVELKKYTISFSKSINLLTNNIPIIKKAVS